MNENRLKSYDIENAVKVELNNLEFEYKEENPQQNIYIEIIGINSGISVLKSCELNDNNKSHYK